MKLLLNILLSIIIALPLNAQVTVKVYPELSNYVQKQSVKASVFIEHRTVKDIKNAGGNEYMIYSEIDSRDMNDFIENDAWFVRHRDSLFINCKRLKSTEYALVLEKNDTCLFFIAGVSRLKEHKKYMPDNTDYVAMSAAFGPIGGAIVGSETAGALLYYLLNLNTGKIQVLDRDGIAALLAAKPQLKREYLSKASPTDVKTVKDFMHRLFN